jgi:hypothetical protein
MRVVLVLTTFDSEAGCCIAVAIDPHLITSGATPEIALDFLKQLFAGYGVMGKEFKKDFLAELPQCPGHFKTSYRLADPRNRHRLDIEPLLNVPTYG